MKIKSRQYVRKATHKPRKRGFALIATLTLMMLLAIIATALMATAASQNRIAMQTVLQAEARQQALVGLDAAIGELQAQLGPDQRVSASSGIISESEGSTPQHILGVWDSWDGPIYGSGNKSKGRIQSTYSPGRQNQFRKWLISSKDPNRTKNMKGVAGLCSRRPGQRICLVGEGTLGNSLNARHWVYADLLTMPSNGKNEACFAWWIGGENQKAKISVEDPEETNDPIELLHRTWNTPAPMVVDNAMLDFVPTKVEQAAKLTTLGSLPLLGSSSQAAGTPYFFDVTTSSYSLPVNVSMGGFKHDLCLLLNKDSLRGTDFAPRAKQDCPIADNRQVPTGTEQDMPIGSWQTLYAYYNCWPDGTANDGDNFTDRLIGSVSKPHTRMSGAGYLDIAWKYFDDTNQGTRQNDNSSFDARAMMDQGVKGAGYPRTPIMLAYMCNLGLRVTDSGKTTKREGQDEEEKVYHLDMTFSPMFLYWNPYNVTMRVRGGQLWTKTNPYKNLWIEFIDMVRDTWDLTKMKKLVPSGNRKAIQNYTRFNQDWGQSVQNSASDASGDIVFRPGEVLFFSHPSNKSTAPGMEWSNPLALQFWPGSVSSFNVRMYSDIPESVVDQAFIEFNLGAEANSTVRCDGAWFGVGHPECVTVLNGYGGRKPYPSDNEPDNLYRLQSPQRFILGWYEPGTMDVEALTFCRRETNDSSWSTDMIDDSQPYFVASVGAVAKSANTHLDEHIFPDKDFRGRVWAHATPATWGGALVSPSDQERQYHPFQLAALDVSGGLSTAPMDSIGNNGYIGITSDGEQVSLASVMELPVHPPFSLAGLAGMRLTPGWYQVEPSRAGDAHHQGEVSGVGSMRRSAYVSGVPGVGIGNALADPTLPATDVYIFHKSDATEKLNDWQDHTIVSNRRLFGDYFDHGLLINDALWDRWFMSSVSDMPESKGKRKAEDVLRDFLSGKEELPVARYKKTVTPYKDEQVISRLMDGDGWKYIAQYLMVDGGFNVNSISVEAWTAVLQGLARRQLVAGEGDGGGLKIVEPGKGDSQVTFSRFMLSTTDKSIDGLGGYSMLQGSSSFRNSGMLNAWSEVRMLEPESIRKLAEEMVKQVRKRGPFLSMSDFINRRLEEGENGFKGALQAAIDATDINQSFDEIKVSAHGAGNIYANREAENGSLYTAAPGYLIQSDVLMSLGNILTVRDDTFTIRAYGCIKNPSNAILAQAWCEAVVQRTMNYVDPGNDPADAEYNPDGTKGKGLSAVNKVLGRQFQVVSFKWLDLWDI